MPSIRARAGTARRPGPLAAVAVGYLLLVSGVMIWRGISVSPDYLLLVLVPVAIASGRLLGFARDWVPFIALFLGYEALAGVAGRTGIPVHYELVIRLDRALAGGTDPSQWLQGHLGSLRWLAIACTVVYFGHFLIPVAAGLTLWLADRVQFLRFAAALLAMSFAAFAVFLLVPVAPPWLAGQHHLLPHVRSLLALPSAVSPYFSRLDPDTAAAFPSLHAAYPLLAALALRPVTRRAAALALAWSAAVWFSVVYLGQHYVTDVAGGIVLAAGTWLIMTKVAVPHVPALRHQPAGTGEPAATQPGSAGPAPAGPDPAEPDTTAEPAAPRSRPGAG